MLPQGCYGTVMRMYCTRADMGQEAMKYLVEMMVSGARADMKQRSQD